MAYMRPNDAMPKGFAFLGCDMIHDREVRTPNEKQVVCGLIVGGSGAHLMIPSGDLILAEYIQPRLQHYVLWKSQTVRLNRNHLLISKSPRREFMTMTSNLTANVHVIESVVIKATKSPKDGSGGLGAGMHL